ncbi:Di-copper centre-containing protein [Apiospora rasikravindrae]|uniref:Di-copper centre-containing protein n=1 Tax=Apiospora rasikravindrae TaxID=990691 RepID=A0ABR1SKJ1_9PEZI
MLNGMDNGALKNLEVDQATPYLREHLQWRIMDVSGVEIPVEAVESLKVFVAEQEVTPPGRKSKGDFPIFGKATAHLNVTEGKIGSVRSGDDFLHKVGAALATAFPGIKHESHEQKGDHDAHQTHVSQGNDHKNHVSQGSDHQNDVAQGNDHQNHVSQGKGTYRRAVVSQ